MNFFFFFLEHQTAKSRVLHALFLFQEPRGIVTCKLFEYLSQVTHRYLHFIEDFQEFLLWLSRLRTQLVSMRKWIQSPGLTQWIEDP